MFANKQVYISNPLRERKRQISNRYDAQCDYCFPSVGLNSFFFFLICMFLFLNLIFGLSWRRAAGENTAKVDKKLDIPSAVARTRKQSVLVS